MATPDSTSNTPGTNAPQNGSGTAALVLGILQFFCLGIIGSILAIIFGRKGMRLAAEGKATNGGAAKAGYVLGWIGVVLFVIGIIITVIVLIAGGKSSSSTPAVSSAPSAAASAVSSAPASAAASAAASPMASASN